jgi:hypothetical protein
MPINMLTAKYRGPELDCDYGTVFVKLLIRIWKLRISYPDRDIVLHANDVKSCFRQLKHHPDVMGAFSYIIADFLYLSCGLTMGADFSPPNWEPMRRIVEQLATSLFKDDSLVVKHRERLDQLQWSKKLGKSAKFTRAHATRGYKGVLDETGEPEPTPHNMFVDDDMYAEVFDKARIERCVAAGIEAIFIILGESEPDKRQDPISWDKLLEMIIHFVNQLLGQIINTREMTVETPPEYVEKVVKLLSSTWNHKRCSFKLKEAETLAGQLAHISNTAPWLKHLMPHVYTSIMAGIKTNKVQLINTNKHFREQMKIAKNDAIDKMERTFAQSETARKIHCHKKEHWINGTLKEELQLIRAALSDKSISKACPIAHLIPDHEDSEAHGDSSLDSAGGWSTDMQFWWWIDWPEEIKKRTLRYIKDGQSGDLVDINNLEYATVLINYAAACHYWITLGNSQKQNIPYPRVRIMADNVCSEVWATKGCKRSFTGRRLGRLQCAMMINNPVGCDLGHVDTKTNEIADRISRWKTETAALLGFDQLKQEFPQLNCCRRFQPSQEVISLVLDALSSAKLSNPLQVRQLLLKNPGRVTS